MEGTAIGFESQIRENYLWKWLIPAPSVIFFSSFLPGFSDGFQSVYNLNNGEKYQVIPYNRHGNGWRTLRWMGVFQRENCIYRQKIGHFSDVFASEAWLFCWIITASRTSNKHFESPLRNVENTRHLFGIIQEQDKRWKAIRIIYATPVF